jgi:hypothetical protein
MKNNPLIRFLKGMTALLLLFFLFGFTKNGIGTEQGHYLINVESEEKILKVGNHNLKFTFLHKKSKKPVAKKLNLEVIPWLRSGQHYASELPNVRQIGDGQYLIERLNFSQKGDWEVYVRIDKGGKEDAAVFDVDIVE